MCMWRRETGTLLCFCRFTFRERLYWTRVNSSLTSSQKKICEAQWWPFHVILAVLKNSKSLITGNIYIWACSKINDKKDRGWNISGENAKNSGWAKPSEKMFFTLVLLAGTNTALVWKAFQYAMQWFIFFKYCPSHSLSVPYQPRALILIFHLEQTINLPGYFNRFVFILPSQVVTSAIYYFFKLSPQSFSCQRKCYKNWDVRCISWRRHPIQTYVLSV